MKRIDETFLRRNALHYERTNNRRCSLRVRVAALCLLFVGVGGGPCAYAFEGWLLRRDDKIVQGTLVDINASCVFADREGTQIECGWADLVFYQRIAPTGMPSLVRPNGALVYLTDGTRLVGKLAAMDSAYLTLETKYFGKIELDWFLIRAVLPETVRPARRLRLLEMRLWDENEADQLAGDFASLLENRWQLGEVGILPENARLDGGEWRIEFRKSLDSATEITALKTLGGIQFGTLLHPSLEPEKSWKVVLDDGSELRMPKPPTSTSSTWPIHALMELEWQPNTPSLSKSPSPANALSPHLHIIAIQGLPKQCEMLVSKGNGKLRIVDWLSNDSFPRNSLSKGQNEIPLHRLPSASEFTNTSQDWLLPASFELEFSGLEGAVSFGAELIPLGFERDIEVTVACGEREPVLVDWTPLTSLGETMVASIDLACADAERIVVSVKCHDLDVPNGRILCIAPRFLMNN